MHNRRTFQSTATTRYGSGLTLWRPAWTTVIGVFESLATLIALIVTLALRPMIVTDPMLASGTGFVTSPEVFNFLISGLIAYVFWRRGLHALYGAREARPKS